MRYLIIYISFLFLFYSCESIFFEEDPENTPEVNFEIFWKDFDMYYAQFKIRNIDWDSIYTVYRPQINNTTSDIELYNILSEIIVFINDIHVNLYTPFGTASYNNIYIEYPSSKIINLNQYTIPGSSQKYFDIIEYRDIRGYNIGYILLKTFNGNPKGTEVTDDRFLIIDDIIKACMNKDGIIIDIRSNGGGQSLHAEMIASRFADTKRLIFRYYIKNGPGEDDFSDWFDRYIEPKGELQYLKPVVVLTSRETASSAEIFTMAMQVLPQVAIIGDTTSGGEGNPIPRELPNGWTYRLSTKVGATAESYIIEGKGVPPDIPVLTTVEDSINGIDRILEEGINYIQDIK